MVNCFTKPIPREKCLEKSEVIFESIVGPPFVILPFGKMRVRGTEGAGGSPKAWILVLWLVLLRDASADKAVFHRLKVRAQATPTGVSRSHEADDRW